MNFSLSCIGWSIEAGLKRVVLSQFDSSHSVPDDRCCLVISAYFTWSAYVYGKEVSRNLCQLLSHTTDLLHSVSAVTALLKCLSESHVCIGNGDDKFQELQQTRKGVFLDRQSGFYYY